jgi:ABC-2 type transport system permease protein
LGGIFYSIKMLPAWAMTLSQVNPIYYAISALREATLGVSDAPFLTSSIFLIMFTVATTVMAVQLMATGKKIRF